MFTRLLLLAIAFCLAAQPLQAAQPEVSHDGLVRILDPERFQAIWLRPGADLRGYTKLLVLPPAVQYQRATNRSAHARENFALSEAQQARLAEALREVLDEEIVAKGDWQLASERGRDVLVARAALLDLVVSVPPMPPAGRSATFATSFGEATLVVEIYDSQSMQILARIADRQEARPVGRFQRVDLGVRADVRRELRRWATRLREALAFARRAPFPS